MSKLCIGLFGTCGGSKWRDAFIERYQKGGVPFFNPLKDDWKPEDAEIEAEHLAEDAIILFPITSETFATGSLAEVGFSILNAIKLDDRRDFVIMIHPTLDSVLMQDEAAAKESLRSRALVMQHLKKLRLDHLYVVDTLEQMLNLSFQLYGAAKIREPLKVYNPHTSISS